MNGKMKELKAKGEFDYDYSHDTLFFKVRNREYERSIELDNLVLDIDEEGFIVGLQIFDASKYFYIEKKYLRITKMWKMWTSVKKISESECKLDIRLVFRVVVRNRIVQPTPIITQNIKDHLENSRMVCVPVKA